MKMVPAVPRLHKFYNTDQGTVLKHKFINIFTSYFQVFPPAVYSLLEAWVLDTPPSSPPSLQTLNTHTLVIVGLLTSDALLALVFPPFCLEKEKHTAFVFQLGASSLLIIIVKLLEEFLRFFYFLSHGSTMKSEYKHYFYLSGSVLEC